MELSNFSHNPFALFLEIGENLYLSFKLSKKDKEERSRITISTHELEERNLIVLQPAYNTKFYVTEGGKVMILNDNYNAETLKIQGLTLYRLDKLVEELKK